MEKEEAGKRDRARVGHCVCMYVGINMWLGTHVTKDLKGMSHTEEHSRKGPSKCKGPEARTCLVSSRRF